MALLEGHQSQGARCRQFRGEGDLAAGEGTAIDTREVHPTTIAGGSHDDEAP
jgi:hypothetical protein